MNETAELQLIKALGHFEQRTIPTLNITYLVTQIIKQDNVPNILQALSSFVTT